MPRDREHSRALFDRMREVVARVGGVHDEKASVLAGVYGNLRENPVDPESVLGSCPREAPERV